MAGSASSRGSACKFTTWSLKGMVGTLGTYPGRGLRTTWESAGPNSRHESSTENACRSPTLLTVANAERSTVFRDRNLSSTDCRGSKGAPLKADRTEGRSQEGTRWGRGGFSLLAPLRNLMTRLCFPRELPSTASWCAAIAATYTLRVEGDKYVFAPTHPAGKKARLRLGIYGGPPGGENTNWRTGSTSACKLVS